MYNEDNIPDKQFTDPKAYQPWAGGLVTGLCHLSDVARQAWCETPMVRQVGLLLAYALTGFFYSLLEVSHILWLADRKILQKLQLFSHKNTLKTNTGIDFWLVHLQIFVQSLVQSIDLG